MRTSRLATMTTIVVLGMAPLIGACGSKDTSPATVTVTETPSSSASASAAPSTTSEPETTNPDTGNPDAATPAGALAGPTWQVVDIYQNPNQPSGVPDEVAGKATLAFGQGSISGNTGCSQLQGNVKYLANHRPSGVDDATEIIFENIRYDEPSGCAGQGFHTHDLMKNMLHGKYDIIWESDNEILLRRPGGDHSGHAPAIRLAR